MRTSIAAAMVAVVVCCAVLHPIHAIVVDPSRHESRVTPKPVDLAATGVPLEFIRRSDTPTGARSTTSAVPQAPVIYEISTRPWLYFLSQKYNRTIRLATIPTSEFEALAKQGIQVIWMMGVWHLGEYGLHYDQTNPGLLKQYSQVLPGYTQADIIGSPYAITNYTMNPAIGTSTDLANLRALLHSLGMQLCLDFVPNHSAVDATWTSSHPEYYIQKPSSGSFPSDYWVSWDGHTLAHGRDPYDAPWADTCQYNYWQPSFAKAMMAQLVELASVTDMLRCDMSMLILNDVIEVTWGSVMSANGFTRPPTEFWEVAIKAAKAANPNLVMMAECYNYGITKPLPEDETLQSMGFDYTYDKGILDKLKADNLNDLRAAVASRGNAFYQKTCHFVSNHDEPRAAAALGGDQQGFVGAVVTSTLPGARMFYFGQFQGFSSRLLVQLRREVAQPINHTVWGLYDQLVKIVDNPVFHQGTWTNIPTSTSGTEWRLVAWRWALGSHKRLVVVNFSNEQGWGNIVVADASAPSGDQLTITELFSGVSYNRSATTMRTTGLTVGVNAWGAQIFMY